MNVKKAVTWLLLAFVGAGLIYMVVTEAAARRGRQAPGSGAEAAAPSEQGERVVAYYFHGNLRCRTCRTIEAYSEEAIRTEFADGLASGRLAWRVVNVEQPENEHFAKGFSMSA